MQIALCITVVQKHATMTLIAWEALYVATNIAMGQSSHPEKLIAAGWVLPKLSAVILVLESSFLIALISTKLILFQDMIRIYNTGLSLIWYVLDGNARCESGAHSQIQECCDTSHPCGEDQGDCDNDSECLGSLVCGKNNCNLSKFPTSKIDCCEKEQKGYMIGSMTC